MAEINFGTNSYIVLVCGEVTAFQKSCAQNSPENLRSIIDFMLCETFILVSPISHFWMFSVRQYYPCPLDQPGVHLRLLLQGK